MVYRRGDGWHLTSLRDCVRTVIDAVKAGSVAVLDEFQRPPEDYWLVIGDARADAKGVLLVCGSSMGIVKKVFNKRSPLLGVFEAFHVDLASIADTIVSLYRQGLGAREAILWSIVARDPWVLAHVEPRGEPWTVLAHVSRGLAAAARGLVGEVFEEEDRKLTRAYDTVLALLAQGVWRASDIAQTLYSMRLSSSPSPGSATGLLAVLEELGLVERIPLWRTRGARIYYRHRSSLLSILYRLMEVVEELGENPDPNTVKTVFGLELQFNIGELLARYYGLRRAYSIPREGPDIDIVLLDKRGRAVWGFRSKDWSY